MKRVKAWAWAVTTPTDTYFLWDSQVDALDKKLALVESGEWEASAIEVHDLTPRDPSADAALKVLLAWATSLRPLPLKVERAVQRYEKSRGKR